MGTKRIKANDKDNICGFRFSAFDDLIAHKAIIHGIYNGYVQHSEHREPTIQFMKGSDAKDIFIQTLVWELSGNEQDDDEDAKSINSDDMEEIRSFLDSIPSTSTKKKKKKKKDKKRKKKHERNINIQRKNRKRKEKEKKSKDKDSFDEEPPSKKRRINSDRK